MRRYVRTAMQTDLSPPEGLPQAVGDDAGLPRYLQVASTLRTAIVRGVYPVGSRLPTEDELRRRFGVSRHTVREALRQLRNDALITSRPGSRPTVAVPGLPKEHVLFGGAVGEIDEDFFDYMIATRLEIAVMEQAALTPERAQETGLPAGEEWLQVEGFRSHVDHGRITCWHEYLIHPRFATIGRLLGRHVGPIIPLLEDLFGERVVRITRSTSAVSMPPAQAAAFGVTPGSPALNIVSRCQTADGATAVLNRAIHPGGVITHTISRPAAEPTAR
jgi:DNA-binding GntR family transcriptional regulator